jgi:hypothetical protein
MYQYQYVYQYKEQAVAAEVIKAEISDGYILTPEDVERVVIEVGRNASTLYYRGTGHHVTQMSILNEHLYLLASVSDKAMRYFQSRTPPDIEDAITMIGEMVDDFITSKGEALQPGFKNALLRVKNGIKDPNRRLR